MKAGRDAGGAEIAAIARRSGAVLPVLALLVVGLSVAFALTGCGGGDSSTDASSTNETTAEADRTNEVPAEDEAVVKAEGPLGPLSEALEADGFIGTAPQPEDGSVEWHLTAEPKSGGAGIDVAYYRDASVAQKEGREIEHIFGNRPGQGFVYLNGRLLIWVGGEKKLPPSEHQAFEEVVSAAEGIE